ncbi:MAG: hypothetical protein JWN37_725 [Candidatus Nomurabacteria bacterium]|nr:hypothetical protein [Candidatus Nomurabacteria bacterium]
MKQKQRDALGILLVIIAVGALIYHMFMMRGNNSMNMTGRMENTVTFNCSQGKSIMATFYPENDTEVHVMLSDGRMLLLPHAMSGSGARYANTDESIVFWNKGNTAFITEGTSTTYENCVTPTSSNDAGATSADKSHVYTNSTYGFSLTVPVGVTQQDYFSNFYILNNTWRVNSSPENKGNAVVSFVIKRIDQGGIATGKPYPLFFDAEVRVGVSTDTKQCYLPDPGYESEPVTNVVINGITFKKFSFSDAATMKYVSGESYRTIHNNKCYAIEQLKEGSSYRDDTMTQGTPDTELDTYYNQGEQIIKTLKFID